MVTLNGRWSRMVETRPQDQLSTDGFQTPKNSLVREGSSEMFLWGLVSLRFVETYLCDQSPVDSSCWGWRPVSLSRRGLRVFDCHENMQCDNCNMKEFFIAQGGNLTLGLGQGSHDASLNLNWTLPGSQGTHPVPSGSRLSLTPVVLFS